MKKILIVSMYILIVYTGKGQLPSVVSAPIAESMLASIEATLIEQSATNKTTLVNTGKTLSQAIEQTQKAKDHFDHVKKVYEGLKKVNQYISAFRQLEEGIAMQISATKSINESLDRFQKNNIFDVNQYLAISSHLLQLISITNYNINVLKVVLTPGKSKMNDFERLQAIEYQLRELKEKVAIINMTLNEIQILENQIAASRSVYYMDKFFNK